MSLASRTRILNRRSGSAADIASLTIDSCEWTIDDVMRHGLWRINCPQQVGIGTATELGLSADRYPIRVILGAPPAGNRAALSSPYVNAVTVCKYWAVQDASRCDIPFQRRPFNDEGPVKMLYKLFPNIDERLWDHFCTITAPDNAADPELDAIINRFSDNLLLQAPNDEQIEAMSTDLDRIFSQSLVSCKYVRIRIAPNAYIVGRPAGMPYRAVGALPADRAHDYEIALSMLVNHRRMKSQYDGLEPRTVLLASYAVSAMFRFGLFESYENPEFFTIYVTPSDASNTMFTVTHRFAPPGITLPEDIKTLETLTIAGAKFSQKLTNLAPGLLAAAGHNHYLFNHTTGGTICKGALYSILATNKMLYKGQDEKEAELVTSLFYEALHPINKRAIANLFFEGSQVYYHGRAINAPYYEQFNPDAFMASRNKPTPAGARKAEMAATVLKRIFAAGLGPFLPWAEQLSACVELCRNVLACGAESHIDAMYYTGKRSKTPSSTLDKFMPELAAYIQVFAKRDTLALSPHLSPEVAARASVMWSNLLRDLRGKNVHAWAP